MWAGQRVRGTDVTKVWLAVNETWYLGTWRWGMGEQSWGVIGWLGCCQAGIWVDGCGWGWTQSFSSGQLTAALWARPGAIPSCFREPSASTPRRWTPGSGLLCGGALKERSEGGGGLNSEINSSILCRFCAFLLFASLTWAHDRADEDHGVVLDLWCALLVWQQLVKHWHQAGSNKVLLSCN